MMKKWIPLTIALIVVGGGVWFFIREPGPRTNSKFAEGTFTRPKTPASSAAEFRIEIGGKDALTATPIVATNRAEKLDATMPPLPRGQFHNQMLIAVPRLHDSEKEFSYLDYSTDSWVGGSANFAKDPEQRKCLDSVIRFRLAPGEYFVRYYREIRSYDLENPQPTKVELIGKGKLRVIAAEDGSLGKIPLANKTSVAKIFVAD